MDKLSNIIQAISENPLLLLRYFVMALPILFAGAFFAWLIVAPAMATEAAANDGQLSDGAFNAYYKVMAKIAVVIIAIIGVIVLVNVIRPDATQENVNAEVIQAIAQIEY